MSTKNFICVKDLRSDIHNFIFLVDDEGKEKIASLKRVEMAINNRQIV